MHLSVSRPSLLLPLVLETEGWKRRERKGGRSKEGEYSVTAAFLKGRNNVANRGSPPPWKKMRGRGK